MFFFFCGLQVVFSADIQQRTDNTLKIGLQYVACLMFSVLYLLPEVCFRTQASQIPPPPPHPLTSRESVPPSSTRRQASNSGHGFSRIATQARIPTHSLTSDRYSLTLCFPWLLTHLSSFFFFFFSVFSSPASHHASSNVLVGSYFSRFLMHDLTAVHGMKQVCCLL